MLKIDYLNKIKNHWLYSELKALLRLTVPILIGQVAHVAMSTTDSIVAGSVSSTDLAAVSVSTGIWIPVLLFFSVSLMISPLISFEYGRGRFDIMKRLIYSGSFLVFCYAILGTLIINGLGPLAFQWLNIDSLIYEKADRYLFFVSLGMPAALMYYLLRALLEGTLNTFPVMMFSIVGMLLNIPLNFIFVYGYFGMPALGAAGCGLATALIYWFYLITIVLYINFSPKLRAFKLFTIDVRAKWKTVWEIIRFGMPYSFGVMFEVVYFTTSVLIIASLGSEAASAHQIAINVSSTIYMIPLALGSGMAARIGYKRGLLQFQGILNTIKCTYSIFFVLAVLIIFCIHFLAEPIARLYSDDPKIIQTAAMAMGMIMIFVIPDGLQDLAAAGLKGYNATAMIMIATFTAFWGIGFPFSYMLSRTDWIVEPMGVQGVWVGFVLALFTAAPVMSWLLYRKHRQFIQSNKMA